MDGWGTVQNRPGPSLGWRDGIKSRSLGFEQLLNTGPAQTQQVAKLAFVKRGLLAATLQFYEFARLGHDDIHVNFRRRVFNIAKIKQCLLVDDPNADRRDGL